MARARARAPQFWPRPLLRRQSVTKGMSCGDDDDDVMV